jgi:hypothetical protein
MAWYRKKPVEVDAYLVSDLLYKFGVGGAQYLPSHIAAAAARGDLIFRKAGIEVNGMGYAESSDMLIQGVRGDYCFCSPETFDQTYEQVPCQ